MTEISHLRGRQAGDTMEMRTRKTGQRRACDPRAEVRGYTVVLARNPSGPLSSLCITGIPNPINAASLGPTGSRARGKHDDNPTGGTYVTISRAASPWPNDPGLAPGLPSAAPPGPKNRSVWVFIVVSSILPVKFDPRREFASRWEKRHGTIGRGCRCGDDYVETHGAAIVLTGRISLRNHRAGS